MIANAKYDTFSRCANQQVTRQFLGQTKQVSVVILQCSPRKPDSANAKKTSSPHTIEQRQFAEETLWSHDFLHVLNKMQCTEPREKNSSFFDFGG